MDGIYSLSKDHLRGFLRKVNKDHRLVAPIVNRHGDTSADEFILTRFIVTCCVADATVAAVRVVDVTPGKFADGQWVQVDGTFYPVGSDMIVAADSVKEVPQPHNPYMTP